MGLDATGDHPVHSAQQALARRFGAVYEIASGRVRFLE